MRITIVLDLDPDMVPADVSDLACGTMAGEFMGVGDRIAIMASGDIELARGTLVEVKS